MIRPQAGQAATAYCTAYRYARSQSRRGHRTANHYAGGQHMRCIISMVFIQFIGRWRARGRRGSVGLWVLGLGSSVVSLLGVLCSRVVGIRFVFLSNYGIIRTRTFMMFPAPLLLFPNFRYFGLTTPFLGFWRAQKAARGFLFLPTSGFRHVRTKKK